MRDLISWVCDACRRKNYTSSKNKKLTTDKLAMKKFCPACRSHTLDRSIAGTTPASVPAIFDRDAHTIAVVLMLLRLRTVSPQPPSAFWC